MTVKEMEAAMHTHGGLLFILIWGSRKAGAVWSISSHIWRKINAAIRAYSFLPHLGRSGECLSLAPAQMS